MLYITDIGEKIKFYRKVNKLTQKQLSELSGISEISIRKYETGDRFPKLEQLKKIASAFEIGSREFFIGIVGEDIPYKVKEIVSNMLKINISINDIAEVTGLTIWEIHRIEKSNFEKDLNGDEDSSVG